MNESDFVHIKPSLVDHTEGLFNQDPAVLSQQSPRTASEQQLVEDLRRAQACGDTNPSAALERLMRATQSPAFLNYITKHEI